MSIVQLKKLRLCKVAHRLLRLSKVQQVAVQVLIVGVASFKHLGLKLCQPVNHHQDWNHWAQISKCHNHNTMKKTHWKINLNFMREEKNYISLSIQYSYMKSVYNAERLLTWQLTKSWRKMNVLPRIYRKHKTESHYQMMNLLADLTWF